MKTVRRTDAIKGVFDDYGAVRSSYLLQGGPFPLCWPSVLLTAASVPFTGLF